MKLERKIWKEHGETRYVHKMPETYPIISMSIIGIKKVNPEIRIFQYAHIEIFPFKGGGGRGYGFYHIYIYIYIYIKGVKAREKHPSHTSKFFLFFDGEASIKNDIT